MLPTTETGKHYSSLLPQNNIFLLWVNSYSSSSRSNNHRPLFLQRQRDVLPPKEKLIATGLCPAAGGAEDKETSREEAKRDASRSHSWNRITWQKLKKLFPTRMALKGPSSGSPLPRKGSYLVPSPSALCPGACSSQSESVHVDVCREADGVGGSGGLGCVSCGAISFLHLEASPLAHLLA